MFRWHRYSVDLAWELQPDICMQPPAVKDFYFIWLLFYQEHLFVSYHFNCFRKHAVSKIHLGRKTVRTRKAQPKNNVRHFFIRFSILTGILIIGALVDVLTTVCFSGLFVF